MPTATDTTPAGEEYERLRRERGRGLAGAVKWAREPAPARGRTTASAAYDPHGLGLDRCRRRAGDRYAGRVREVPGGVGQHPPGRRYRSAPPATAGRQRDVHQRAEPP